jgi:UrcA family protein
MRTVDKLPFAAGLAALLAVLVPGLVLADPAASAGNAKARPAALHHIVGSHDSTEPRSIRIAYSDLDLKTPEGMAALFIRIHRAAEDLCGANSAMTGTRLVGAAAEACVRSSVATTIRQIGVPGLATLDAEPLVLGGATAPAKPQCDTPVRAKIII